MIDYRKLYSELRGPGEVSPEMVNAARSAEQSGAFRSKHPDIFDADHPLAFSDAQNTAQKAKDKSDELQDAFKAASEGNFHDIPSDIAAFESFKNAPVATSQYKQPQISESALRGQQTEKSIEESMDKFYASIGLKKDPVSGGWKNKQGQIEIGKPQWGVTVPGWSSSGAGFDQSSSSSNIAPFGFEKVGKKMQRMEWSTQQQRDEQLKAREKSKKEEE
jgi:hypothetical protein